MPGPRAPTRCQILSRWNKSATSTKSLLEVDSEDGSSSKREFAGGETQSPLIQVKLCLPSPKQLQQSDHHSRLQKPSAWKRILRKLRAEATKVHLACCQGICLPREIPDYSSFTYTKNFDDGGKSYWRQQRSFTAVTPLPSSAPPELEMNACRKRSSNSSSYGDLMEQVRVEVRVDPLWQRRNAISPTKLRVKKVSFADEIWII